MNPFEMVFGIVLITAIASVVRAKLNAGSGRRGLNLPEMNLTGGHAPDTETQRLRDEVRALKERVAVLERLATDDSHRLESEIEKLRSLP